MPVEIICGAQWGDEGKGKLTDACAVGAAAVVRFQGGRNAGHTVVCDQGVFALHLLPSGVLRPEVDNVLAPGVAVDPPALVAEIDGLVARGVSPRVFVSERAQIVTRAHIEADGLEEERLGRDGFGSTRAGIAPFYADKAAKRGIQVGDVADPARLRERIAASLAHHNAVRSALYGVAPLEVEEVAAPIEASWERIAPLVADTSEILDRHLAAGSRVLAEGQLGTLRDPDWGIYPFSTSSSPIAGNATVGAGLAPRSIERVIAVAKAYSTCVGTGPFPVERTDAVGDDLRARGGHAGEYGATTGRPRRVGWFDVVATRHGVRHQGATEVALTGLDVLGHLAAIPICVAYEIDGRRTKRFPATAALERARPLYESLDGWERDVTGARQWHELPRGAQRYVERLELELETPIAWISVGPERDALIRR